MTADKKDNYLNGYCTGQTDLLQAMIDQAPAAYMYDQARYGPTDLRGQQWLPELSRLKPYEGNGMVRDVTPLYTIPPQRTWVGLTDEEIVGCATGLIVGGMEFAKAIEAKLKEKNT